MLITVFVFGHVQEDKLAVYLSIYHRGAVCENKTS